MQIDLELDISLDIHHQRRKDKIASPFSRVHKEKKGGGGEKKLSLIVPLRGKNRLDRWLNAFCTVFAARCERKVAESAWHVVGRGKKLIRAKVRGGDDDVELAGLFYSCYLSFDDWSVLRISLQDRPLSFRWMNFEQVKKGEKFVQPSFL